MATLNFSVEQPKVQAGQALVGSLNIHASRKIHCSKFEIYFRGKEYTRITTGYGKHRRTHAAKVLIVKKDLSCQGRATQRLMEGGFIYPGSYSVPFHINLPANLPSSMGAFKGDHSARIEYCLRAVLVGSGTFTDYQVRRQVKVVAKPVPHETVPMTFAPTVQPIRYFNSIAQGEMSIGARVLDTKLAPGQRPGVLLSIINDSRASLKSINLSLQQMCHFTAPRHSLFDNHMATKEVTKEVMSNSFHMQNQLKPLDKKTIKEMKAVIGTRRMENHYKIRQQLKESKALRLTLPPIPQHVTESFRGERVQVFYRLVIKLLTEDKFTDPQLALDVTIAPAVRASMNSMPLAVARTTTTTTTTTATSPPMAEVIPISDESVRDYADFSMRIVPVSASGYLYA